MSAETISNITNRVLVDVKEWQSRALKPVYSVVFMDGAGKFLVTKITPRGFDNILINIRFCKVYAIFCYYIAVTFLLLAPAPR